MCRLAFFGLEEDHAGNEDHERSGDAKPRCGRIYRRSPTARILLLYGIEIIEKLLGAGLISEGEFNKITEKNRQTFSPYLVEIMPEMT